MSTIVEVDLESREVVRTLGRQFPTFADAYGFVQTQFGDWMPELDIHNRGFFPLPGGERAIIIAVDLCNGTCPECDA
jgi:hypothetical protein